MVDSKMQFQTSEMKTPANMHVTNEEFFKQTSCMYFTDEVQVKQIDEMKFVNEFQVLNSIGRGAFSKVKRVVRRSICTKAADDDLSETAEDEVELAEFAMKIMHKPTLKRERAVRYDTNGEMQMINNFDKVQNEIEIWTQLNHPYIAKLFEMIDDEQHDYLYLILELADMGQISNWNFKTERYERSQETYKFVVAHLEQHAGLKADQPQVEQVACYLFRQLIAAVIHLHTRLQVIHRDIKPENILFSSQSAELKLTDFTVSRGELKEGVRLFDSEGTACFTAPECHIVERDGYDPMPTDIWSMGVCLFSYVDEGRLPFYG